MAVWVLVSKKDLEEKEYLYSMSNQPTSNLFWEPCFEPLTMTSGAETTCTTPTPTDPVLSDSSRGWSAQRETIGLLYRAIPQEARYATHLRKNLTVDQMARRIINYNDLSSRAEVRAWYERALELTL